MINLAFSGVANHQTVSLQNGLDLSLAKNSAGQIGGACACSLNAHSIIKPDLLSAKWPLSTPACIFTSS